MHYPESFALPVQHFMLKMELTPEKIRMLGKLKRLIYHDGIINTKPRTKSEMVNFVAKKSRRYSEYFIYELIENGVLINKGENGNTRYDFDYKILNALIKDHKVMIEDLRAEYKDAIQSLIDLTSKI